LGELSNLISQETKTIRQDTNSYEFLGNKVWRSSLNPNPKHNRHWVVSRSFKNIWRRLCEFIRISH